MKIIINGQPKEVDKNMGMSELLQHLDIGTKGVAVAINDRIIPRTQWDSFIVEDGNDITIIRATCGG